MIHSYKILLNSMLLLAMFTVFSLAPQSIQYPLIGLGISPAFAHDSGGDGGDGAEEVPILHRGTNSTTRKRGVQKQVAGEIGALVRFIAGTTALKKRLIDIRDRASRGSEIYRTSSMAVKALRRATLEAIKELEVYLRLAGLESGIAAVMLRDAINAKKAMR